MWPFDFFERNSLPDDEVKNWIFDVYGWLIEHLGKFSRFSKTPLIYPTIDFFPPDAQGFYPPNHIFALVAHHAGMTDWPCRLEEVGADWKPSEELMAVMSKIEGKKAAGSIQVDERNEVVIRYAAEDRNNPLSLAATFAHEFAHYLLGTIKEECPGGEPATEPATDVGAIFMGFGILSANNAFCFKQFADAKTAGWNARWTGYLNEISLTYALAIFTVLTETPPRQVSPHLKTNPKSFFKWALRDLHKHERARLDALRAII